MKITTLLKQDTITKATPIEMAKLLKPDFNLPKLLK